MKDAKTFWNQIAAKYAKQPIADMDSYEYTLARTRSYLKPTDTVLEVGCGTGSTAILLAQNVASMTATDISDQMIEVGRAKARDENVQNLTFQEVDVLNTGLNGEKFDAVLAHNLLHLIEDLPTSLAQISQHLEPGGVFISKSVCGFGQNAPLKFRLIKTLIPLMQFLGKAPFVAFRTIEDHEAAIKAAGFEIVESGNFPQSPPSRYVVAIKT